MFFCILVKLMFFNLIRVASKIGVQLTFSPFPVILLASYYYHPLCLYTFPSCENISIAPFEIDRNKNIVDIAENSISFIQTTYTRLPALHMIKVSEDSRFTLNAI